MHVERPVVLVNMEIIVTGSFFKEDGVSEMEQHGVPSTSTVNNVMVVFIDFGLFHLAWTGPETSKKLTSDSIELSGSSLSTLRSFSLVPESLPQHGLIKNYTVQDQEQWQKLQERNAICSRNNSDRPLQFN